MPIYKLYLTMEKDGSRPEWLVREEELANLHFTKGRRYRLFDSMDMSPHIDYISIKHPKGTIKIDRKWSD